MTFNVEHVHLKTRDPAATARFYMETSDHSDFGSAAAGESSTVQRCMISSGRVASFPGDGIEPLSCQKWQPEALALVLGSKNNQMRSRGFATGLNNPRIWIGA